MSKNFVLGVATIVILLITVVGFVLTKSKESPTVSNTPQETAVTSAQKSLKELFSEGNSQECTFKFGENSEGMAFVSKGNVRTDFTTTVSGTAMTGHLVSNGKTSYMWMEGQKTGFKMSFEEKLDSSSIPSGSSSVDINQKLDYRCKPWTHDETKFTLPVEVQFSDFGSITKPQVPSPSGMGSKGTQCSSCDQVPSGYRDQCRSALGCN